MSVPITAILVEDDRLLRESLEDYLRLTGFQVTAVGDGMGFYKQLHNKTFEVAVIDIGLPDQSGYVLIEYARRNTSMGLIIITALDAVDARLIGYQSGSDLFFSKPVDCRELAVAITNLAVRQRERVSPAPSPSANRNWYLDRGTWLLLAPDGTGIKLTNKEFQLLDLLLQTPGIPVSRIVILRTLYGDDNEHASHALDTLVRRLRYKISLQIKADQPLMTAHGTGYFFAATPA